MPARRLMIGSVVVALTVSNTACEGVFKLSDTGIFGFGDSADPFSGDGTDSGVDGDVDGVDGTVTGLVTVQPYVINDDGDIEYVDWKTMSGGEFPYGNIFVSAYTTDEVSGEREYHAQQSILAPSIDGDAYELTMEVDDASAVNIYAALDYHGDGVIGTTEPVGAYPASISVVDGDVISDVNITILAEAWYTGSGGGGGGGDGGDSSENCVTVSGMVDITVGYAGGEVGVMFQDPTTGDGPMEHAVGWSVPQGDSEGAEGEYSFEICGVSGEANLIGGWDKNYNRLLDPSDRWGTYATSEDVDGNPVTLELGTELEDHTVQIPLGDSAAFDIVPMVHLVGEVSMIDDSTFDTLPTHTNVYVAALKYRPDTDISSSDLPDGYDFAGFDWSELSGETAVPFDLMVPSNTTLYLWAYADTDGDGVLNEVDEPIAAASGSDNGRISVTSIDLIGYELEFQVPDDVE